MIRVTFILFSLPEIVYNIYMLTPRNITDLKDEVREYIVTNPDMRTCIKILSDTENTDKPDLFGWVRVWLAVKYQQGASIDLHELFGEWDQ